MDPTPLARGLVRKKVEVVNYPDGRFAVRFNGTALGFRVFDKIQTVQPGAIVDNKRLSAVLEQIKAQQAGYCSSGVGASYPVFVHRLPLLLHASFRPRLAATALALVG